MNPNDKAKNPKKAESPLKTGQAQARPGTTATQVGTPPEGPRAPIRPPGQPATGKQPQKPAPPARPNAPQATQRFAPQFETPVTPVERPVGVNGETAPVAASYTLGDVYKAMIYSRVPNATPEMLQWSKGVIDWYGQEMAKVQMPPGQQRKMEQTSQMGRQPTEPRGVGAGPGQYKAVTTPPGLAKKEEAPGKSAAAPGQTGSTPGQMRKAAQSTYYNNPQLRAAPWKRNQMMQRMDYSRGRYGGAAPGAVNTAYNKGPYNPRIGGSLMDLREFLRLMMQQIQQPRAPYKTY